MTNATLRLRIGRLLGYQERSEPTPPSLCEVRGYCGPFTRQALFDSLETWRGFGRCEECGRTVPAPFTAPEAGRVH